jgi:hypothetical protein
MAMKTRDWYSIAFIGALIFILFLVNNGGGKAPNIPNDERHRTVLDALAKGKEKEVVELVCATCHNPVKFPLSKGHPPKEQCLICHKSK